MAATTIGVMVIDTGFTPNAYVKHTVVHTEGAEKVPHGTKVVYAMLNSGDEVCKQVVVFMCGESNLFKPEVVIDCLQKADQLGVRYVNMSFSGSKDKSLAEEQAIKKLIDKGVQFTISSGNSSLDLDKVKLYPQEYAKKYNNITIVGAKDLEVANTGSFVVTKYSGKLEYVDGSVHKGTSYSSPRHMNKLLHNECKRRGYLESSITN